MHVFASCTNLQPPYLVVICFALVYSVISYVCLTGDFLTVKTLSSLSLSIYLSDAGALVSLQQTLNTVCVSSYRSLTARVRWMRRRDADIEYMQRCGVVVGVRVAAVGHRQHGGQCRLHGQHAATVRRHKIARALLDASSERRSIKI